MSLNSPPRRARTITIAVLAVVAFLLVIGGILLMLGGFSLRPDVAPPANPDPTPSVTETVEPTPAPDGGQVSRPEAPGPPVDPDALLEFGEFDRTNLVSLPRVEPPGERSLTIEEIDTGLGVSIAVPDWLQRYDGAGNFAVFAAPDAWLSVERYTPTDGPRTLENALDGMNWGGHYEEITPSGDDTDWQITSRDTRDNQLRHERILNGDSDTLVIRWWSSWDDDALRGLAAQVIDSAAATTPLDQAQPAREPTPSPDPMVDVFGWFSTPLPPDYTRVSPQRTETLLHDPELILQYVSISHHATAERLTLEASIDQASIPVAVVTTGGDEDEFWWNGATDSFGSYRHYFVGENGYVQVTVLYDIDDEVERETTARNLEFVLEHITIAPLS